MKVKDIAKNIDKSEANNTQHIDFDALANDLGVPFSFDQDPPDNRLQAYWVANWYCTDSWVGDRLYFFDNEPVAYSVQNGRKDDEHFFWFSEEAARKVKVYVLSLIARENNHFTVCDINEDIGDSYKINYLSQVLDWSMARYHGQPIELVEIIKDEKDYYGFDAKLRIKITDNGEEHLIEVKDLDFVYHLCEPQKNPSLDNQIQTAAIRNTESQISQSKLPNVYAKTEYYEAGCLDEVYEGFGYRDESGTIEWFDGYKPLNDDSHKTTIYPDMVSEVACSQYMKEHSVYSSEVTPKELISER